MTTRSLGSALSVLHEKLQFMKTAEYSSDRATMALNKFKPVSERREPDEAEAAELKAAKSKWLPDLITTPGEPITHDLASPGRQAILAGALAGLMGAGAGYAGTQTAKQHNLVPADVDEKKVAAVSGLSTAALAAMAAYVNRFLKNESRSDMILRMPKGSTMRDLYLNPVYQIENDPSQLAGIRQTAILSAALRGRFRERNFEPHGPAGGGGGE